MQNLQNIVDEQLGLNEDKNSTGGFSRGSFPALEPYRLDNNRESVKEDDYNILKGTFYIIVILSFVIGSVILAYQIYLILTKKKAVFIFYRDEVEIKDIREDLDSRDN